MAYVLQIYEELSRASPGKPLGGYVAVVCFLVREGADWHMKNRKGISPRQSLPPEAAALVSNYLKDQ